MRDRIVAVALTWLHTRYEDKQRVKHVGVDCVNFAAGVWEEVSECAPIILPEYFPQWHLHQSKEIFLEGLEAFGCVEKPVDQRLVGDLLLFQSSLACSHCGIFMPKNMIIHAYIKCGKVVMHRLLGAWRSPECLKKCYSYPGVDV